MQLNVNIPTGGSTEATAGASMTSQTVGGQNVAQAPPSLQPSFGSVRSASGGQNIQQQVRPSRAATLERQQEIRRQILRSAATSEVNLSHGVGNVRPPGQILGKQSFPPRDQ